MISRDEMLPLLVEACPSFRPQWEACRDEVDHGAACPHYWALALFARHLIELLARDETATFLDVFAVVERLHTEGEHYVREAVKVGLLEDLRNDGLHLASDPSHFRVFLGPESDRWWQKLDGFWERGELLRGEE